MAKEKKKSALYQVAHTMAFAVVALAVILTIMVAIEKMDGIGDNTTSGNRQDALNWLE